ncbi:pyridoxine 5'-phosphate synthase [Sodalis sp. CWE]|uniref:pyridoxine 5'-phosphate synthase n=1 Tax=Sodalis sp. CWE TaxID=2803816 RepID=UPI001C7DF807|nr:pyridoxine 5'-phosphate synthase [Sodalis sp. CWE]MBX4181025.1 pyridoxine 5'-phosphate synthase [Sodalis sp. CWE]
MSELLLGVNIDHIATVRNVRKTAWPDPILAAFISEQAGADSITVHLREDRRHITDRDIQLLRKTIYTKMNLEMAATKEMISIACNIAPYSCCLVPEKRQEITTECGLDVVNQLKKLKQVVSQLSDFGIQVSLFIDPDEKQIAATADVGAPCIEIHTGAYANAINEEVRMIEFSRIRKSVDFAVKIGLKVNAGHGLDYHNVKAVAALPQIQELNIGHAIIGRAVISGLAAAVKDMKHLMYEARS